MLWQIVQWLYPEIDAPDNWALAITWAVKATVFVSLVAFVWLGIGALLVGARRRDTSRRIGERCIDKGELGRRGVK